MDKYRVIVVLEGCGELIVTKVEVQDPGEESDTLRVIATAIKPDR
jgi:hypothetical protein